MSYIESFKSPALTRVPEEEIESLILGDNFLSPEDMSKACGWIYSDAQLAEFERTTPEFETLEWLKKNDCLLVATAPNDMTLFQVYGLYGQLFNFKSRSWYAKNDKKLAPDDVVRAGQWLMIRKNPHPDSQKKTWNDQVSMLTEAEYVPNITEMSYVLAVYLKIRGTLLIEGINVRTSSVNAVNERLILKHSKRRGLKIYPYWDNHKAVKLGVSSARN